MKDKFTKDGRADIRINKIIKEAIKDLNTSPQSIIDAWIKKNWEKILKTLKK